jgi:glycogen synthase
MTTFQDSGVSLDSDGLHESRSFAPPVDPDRAPGGVVLLEVGWEVCNPIGGIYQVLRSKSPSMVRRWQNRYMLVGPYMGTKSSLEFEPRRPTGWIARVVDEARAQGLVVHHGRWLVPGRPRVLLVEHQQTTQRLNELKHRLWEDFQCESPSEDDLVDSVLSFADATHKLLTAVAKVWTGSAGAAAAGTGSGTRRVLAHFHEWMSGMAIPMLHRDKVPISTVFQTHATLLGRYIASSEGDFYARLPSVDPDAEARHFGIYPQHGYERASAKYANVFTTISPITAEECGHLLGREPDLILPNGLNIDWYSVGHEFQTLHGQFKQRINEFVTGHFFQSYSFDLDKTVYFFTSGRYEPRNKGFDLCLEACARLNDALRRSRLGTTVVLFIITRRPTISLLPEALQTRGMLRELRDVCDRITHDISDALFRRAAAGERVSLDALVDEYWSLRLRRVQAAIKTDRLPPYITHMLPEEAQEDELVTKIKQLGLLNHPEDRVKVVYHPDFISPTSPLWGIEYEQFVRGCHLGLFPSAYEPWGYTPMECVALGVPAVTSDLAGFGRHVAEMYPDHNRWGMWMLQRRGRDEGEVADALARRMLEFCALDRRGRIALRNEVERRSWNFDWARMGLPYHRAHDLALARGKAAMS